MKGNPDLSVFHPGKLFCLGVKLPNLVTRYQLSKIHPFRRWDLDKFRINGDRAALKWLWYPFIFCLRAKPMVLILLRKNHCCPIQLFLHPPGQVSLQSFLTPSLLNTGNYVVIKPLVYLLGLEFLKWIQVLKDNLNGGTFAHATVYRSKQFFDFVEEVMVIIRRLKSRH